MTFLKRQFSVGGGGGGGGVGSGGGDVDADGWENVLVQDMHDDSPIEQVLVDAPVVKKQQVQKKAAPVQKVQEKKDKPAQALFDWDNVLVQDSQDDSPIDEILVDTPLVKKQQVQRKAAPVQKTQGKKVKPTQAKQAGLFDWDSVLVEDGQDDSPIEQVLVDAPVVKKQQVQRKAAPVQKVQEKKVKPAQALFDWDNVLVQDSQEDSPIDEILVNQPSTAKPSKPTKRQQKVFVQKLKEAMRKEGVFEFDWDSVFVYDGDAHNPLDDILVASKEEQQVLKPAAKKAPAPPLVKDGKKVAKSFDWISVVVEDGDQDDVFDRVLASPPSKKTVRSSFAPPKVTAAANVKKTRGNVEQKAKQPVQQQQAKRPTASTKKKAAKIDLSNLFAFDGDAEGEDVIFAPTPQSTKPKKVRGINWNIFPQVYKEEKPEEKQKQFINAKKEMERTIEESIKSVKIGKWPSISAKIYPKSSPQALEKSRKEYEDAKKAIAKKVKSFGRQIFQLFQ